VPRKSPAPEPKAKSLWCAGRDRYHSLEQQYGLRRAIASATKRNKKGPADNSGPFLLDCDARGGLAEALQPALSVLPIRVAVIECAGVLIDWLDAKATVLTAPRTEITVKALVT